MTSSARTLMSFLNKNKIIVLPLSLLVVVGAILLVRPLFGSRKGRPDNPAHAVKEGDLDESDDESDHTVTLKTLYPHDDIRFVREVTAPAYVEPYYKVDLYAQVAGKVTYIEKNIGDRVTAGEVLIEVDDPELAQDVLQKEVLVKQASSEAQAARAKEKTMEEAVQAARHRWNEKKTAVDQAKAIRDLREQELKRYKYLASQGAALPDLVEEREKDVRVAVAALNFAEVAILTAESEYKEYKAKLAESAADIKVKEARVDVAQKAKEKADALLGLTKIRAPFNGVIIARLVDPGAFVQNATTARTTPMLSLIRSDIVTISTMAPERFAPFVRPSTEAEINIEVEPGKPIRNLHSKITRFSPYLDHEKGRTMRIEVDLFNPPTRDFKKAVDRAALAFVTPLASDSPLSAVTLIATGKAEAGRPGLMKPGMYGSMRLVLEKFTGPNIVPSRVVVSRGEKTYVWVVQHGKAHLREVRVLLEDGARSRIAFVTKEADPATGEDERLENLDGSEEIIASGLTDLVEGEEIHTAPTK